MSDIIKFEDRTGKIKFTLQDDDTEPVSQEERDKALALQDQASKNKGV